jgi:hypothetical protein
MKKAVGAQPTSRLFDEVTELPERADMASAGRPIRASSAGGPGLASACWALRSCREG